MAFGDFVEQSLDVAGNRPRVPVVLAVGQREIVEQKLLRVVLGDDPVRRAGVGQLVEIGQSGDARAAEAELIRVGLGIDQLIVAHPDLAGTEGRDLGAGLVLQLRRIQRRPADQLVAAFTQDAEGRRTALGDDLAGVTLVALRLDSDRW